MTKCQYYLEYRDSNNKRTPFDCELDAKKSGLCIFHHKEYYIENTDEVINQLKERIQNSISNNEKLLCIGYHIPDVTIEGEYNQPVYFNNAEFRGIINFKCTFNSLVSFTNARFYNQTFFSENKFKNKVSFLQTIFDDETLVNFSNTEFEGEANFTSAKFNNRVNFSNTKFEGEANFPYAKFNNKVNFDCTTFWNKVDFSAAVFENEASVNFSNTKFEGEANFTSAKFNNIVIFDCTTFKKKVDFITAVFDDEASVHFIHNTKFEGEANFTYAKFNNRVRFIGVRFCDKVNFSNITFNDEVTYSHSTFDFKKSEPIFTNSEFNNRANFQNIIFGNNTEFSGCKFTENSVADFSGFEFKAQVTFSNCKFDGDSIFTKAHFKEAIFTNAKFNNSYFDKVIFDENAESKFDNSIFSGKVNFNEAQFKNKIDFTFTNFKDVNFTKTIFKEANFSGSVFERVNFNHSEFGNVKFYQSLFHQANFSNAKFKENADFKFVRFEQGEKILFDVEDLSKLYFLNTDISKVRFGQNTHWGSHDGFKIIDEENLEEMVSYAFKWKNIPTKDEDKLKLVKFLKKIGIQDTDNLTFENVTNKKIIAKQTFPDIPSLSIEMNDKENIASMKIKDSDSDYIFIVDGKFNPTLYPIGKKEDIISIGGIRTIYRNLRENYEYSLRFEEADKFFEKEMEVKRKYNEKTIGNISRFKKNGWFKRNLTLTGLYYHLTEYGRNYKRPLVLSIIIIIIPILYSLIQSSINGNLRAEIIGNTTETNIRNIFHIDEKQDIIGYFIGIATIPILGALIIAALKRTFEKKFRR